MLTGAERSRTASYIVEIIGLAGAGKSSLTCFLCQQKSDIREGEYLTTRNIRHVPYILKHTLLSLPILLPQSRNGRGFTLREGVKVAYLNGWHQVLMKRGTYENSVFVLDQGPIFELATLHGFGPEKLQEQRYAAWWRSMYEQWSRALDLVVWLDAPVEILIERINSREKWHPVKEQSVQVMRDYLARYRHSHEHVMSELAALHGVNVIRFDTSLQTTDDIVPQVLDAINEQQIRHHS